jgi:hypothetical protein
MSATFVAGTAESRHLMLIIYLGGVDFYVAALGYRIILLGRPLPSALSTPIPLGLGGRQIRQMADRLGRGSATLNGRSLELLHQGLKRVLHLLPRMKQLLVLGGQAGYVWVGGLLDIDAPVDI